MLALTLFEEAPIVLLAVLFAFIAWRGLKIIIIHRRENGDKP